jgi:hypothetical protein
MGMLSTMRLPAVVWMASCALLACGDNQSIVPVDAPTGFLDASLSAVDGPLSTPDAQPDGPLPPDAPGPADAAVADAVIPDAFVIGDAGVALMRSFHFTTDTDGLTQNFASPGAAMTWKNDDGDPPGALSFAAISAGTIKVISSEFTWETWGVPPGAEVVFIRMASYKRRLAAISDMDHSWAFQLVGADNLPAHDGKDGAYLEQTSLTHTPQATWETVSDLPAFMVNPGYRASNTPLFVKVWYFPLLTGAIDWRLDEIDLEITYIMP